MNCEEFEELFPSYLEGDYDQIGDLEGFEGHFSSCEKCWEKYSGLYGVEIFLRENRKKMLQESPTLKSESDFIDEKVAKGVEGEALIKAFGDRFGKKDETIEGLFKIVKAYDNKGGLDEHIKRLDIILDGLDRFGNRGKRLMQLVMGMQAKQPKKTPNFILRCRDKNFLNYLKFMDEDLHRKVVLILEKSYAIVDIINESSDLSKDEKGVMESVFLGNSITEETQFDFKIK